ncbi:MAG: hypothetical protein Q8P69_00065 [bacterium]|nr:hypothetical protein [bacterium]
MQVESRMGIVFVALLALFMAGILFIAIQNYTSDQIVLDASATEIKTMSSTERQLIAQWIKDNNIPFPDGKGYRDFVQEYPNRPWINY